MTRSLWDSPAPNAETATSPLSSVSDETLSLAVQRAVQETRAEVEARTRPFRTKVSPSTWARRLR